MSPMDIPTPICRVIQITGGQTALAKKLGVTPPTVHQWVSGARQVPAERCPDIEALVDGQVTCEQLRPDVNWSVLRRRNAAGDAALGSAGGCVTDADLDRHGPVKAAGLDQPRAEPAKAA